MALPSSQDEIIRWIMEMDAKAALAQLRQLREEVSQTAGANGFKKLEQSAKVFATQVAQMSKQQQRDWRVVLKELIAVDAQLAKMQKRTSIGRYASGNVGSAFAGITEQDISKIMEGNIALGKYKVTQDGVVTSTKATSTAMEKASTSTGKFSRSLNVARLAAGALVAVGLFRFLNFIETAIRKTIESVQQLEVSMIKLANAEKVLSRSGIEITMKDFRDMAKETTELFPFISDIDAQKMVAQIALLTKELRLAKDDIADIVTAIPILAVRAGITIDQATQQVITGLTTSGRGWKDLGIVVDAAIIRQAAVSQKLVESEAAYNALTAEQKQQVEVLALIGILNGSINDELQNQDDYLGTVSESMRELNAEWENLTTIAGQVFKPVLLGLSQALIIYLQIWKAGFTFIGIGFTELASTIFTVVEIINQAWQGHIRSLDDVKKAYVTTSEEIKQMMYGALFPTGIPEIEIGTAITGQVGMDLGKMLGLDRFLPNADTATGAIENLKKGIESIEELEGFDDLVDDLGKLQDKLEDLNEEFKTQQDRAEFDYLRDIERIQEDYAIKRERLIEDTNEKIEDANRKHHNRQKDDEAKFQEQMRQLREKFLFNLEDALRERDARQVLRLQRQYQMDKTALENEHALRQQQQDTQHQEDLQRIRDDRDDRLRELAEEERIRLQREREDYELKKQREEEDHARDLEDLKAQIDERLMEFARAIGEEYDLNDAAVNALYDLLQKYYGPQGMFDQMYDYSYDSMVAKAQGMLGAINAIVGQAQTALASIYYGSDRDIPFLGLGGRIGTHNVGPQAKGGTYLATRPTTATFGEAGPEIAQFIPLSKLKSGSGAGSVGGCSMGGLVEIDLLLSPDLEARVIRNILNETAQVITKVRRTK